MAAAGVRISDDLILVGGYDAETSAECARQLLTRDDPPTAIFGANDVSAIAAIEAATGLGLRVPADLSVVGFDNIPESALCSPPLTTVNQPIRQMGERSIQLLLQLMRGDRLEFDAHHAGHRPGGPALDPGAVRPRGAAVRPRSGERTRPEGSAAHCQSLSITFYSAILAPRHGPPTSGRDHT